MNYHTRTASARRRRAHAMDWVRFAGTLAILVLLATFWVSAFRVLAAGATLDVRYPDVSEPFTPANNNPASWGPDCVKHEQALQGPRWQADHDFRLVVLKAGTKNHLFFGVTADTWLSTPGKDISHVIECGPSDPPPPTYPTVPPTTTEVPPTTTTEAPPTTTEQPPATTTPIPPSTTVNPPSPSTTVPEVPSTTETPCQEDEPCWDCETMGNRICGTPPVIPEAPAPTPVPDDPQFTG